MAATTARKGWLRVEERLLKKQLKEIPNEHEFVKRQLSEVKEKIFVIARTENTRRHWQKKRKARRNFEKKPFKFTKKLFEGEKNWVLNIPKENLEAHLQEKYTNPLTDTLLGHLNEPNYPHPQEEKFVDSPLRLGEIKDFVRKAQAKSSLGINGISYKLIGLTLQYFKMAVMPLVLETKIADLGKLISLENLLARKTTGLVLTTTSATSILSHVFGAYYMTKIVYKYSHLPTLNLFPL